MKTKIEMATQQSREKVTISRNGDYDIDEDNAPCWEDVILYLVRSGQAKVDRDGKE